MAGDWIKMRIDLGTSPKVVRVASALRADRLRVVGGLHAVWCLFDVHSEDGKLHGYTTDALDEMIGFPGFAAAMISVGWLEDGGDYLGAPRFDEHNGQSAKRRAMETERKREARKVSASHADKKRSREEKRRDISTTDVVDKSDPPQNAPKPEPNKATVAQPEGVEDQLWLDFTAMRRAKKAPVTATAIKGIQFEAAKAGVTLAQALAMCCARGWQGFKAEWLRDDRKAAATVAAPAESFRERDERIARERMAAFLPGIAAKPPRPIGANVIDITPAVEELDYGHAKSLGR